MCQLKIGLEEKSLEIAVIPFLPQCIYKDGKMSLVYFLQIYWQKHLSPRQTGAEIDEQSNQ